MIVVTLTYKKPLAEVDAALKGHIAFLDHYYEQRKFLASGRRENRVGGVILVLSSSIQEVEEIMKNDPFYIHGVADYDFMWFEPSKSLEEIKEFV
ncbi:YCII-related domain protein [Acinetobacter calcoaceticus]|uniref:YCII-related domain protein n=1 Tax=Acinetobacter calcoaceticus TaxID=471 RepID=A0A446ZFI3_ACICA|nr:YciI family protein [Acinetobacter calcoaceticus]VAX43247.1 YCII-related domain protein [Acinetobacter calcoaceticus]